MSDGKDDITIGSYDYSEYNIDTDYLDMSDLNIGDITIDSSYYSTVLGSSGSNTISITGGGGNATLSSNGASWATASPAYSTGSGLHVDSDAHFEGDIKWQGRSLGKMMEKIESRLAILTPDSEKLEHFAALKKAYDHYKALEALCELPKEDEDEDIQ
jgi:hypothetical protein